MVQKDDSHLVDIPGFDTWEIIEPITQGWSHDQKYHIKDYHSREFLLRISNASSFKQQYSLYTKLQEIDLPETIVPRLIDIGICNSGKSTYRLFTWIAGEVIIEQIAHLTKKEQYQYGLSAGRILKVINEIEPPKNHLSWKMHYGQKIKTKIALYHKCQLKIAKEDILLSYIEKHQKLIDGRPQCFQHGDYHLGNMLLTPQNELAVIDFDRLDFGDPWEEFNRITWTASESPVFASGQIDGYFDDVVPENFFKLLGLYLCVNQLGSIPWAKEYGEKEIAVAIEKTEEVLDWFDDFKRLRPQWYIPENA